MGKRGYIHGVGDIDVRWETGLSHITIGGETVHTSDIDRLIAVLESLQYSIGQKAEDLIPDRRASLALGVRGGRSYVMASPRPLELFANETFVANRVTEFLKEAVDALTPEARGD